MDQHLTGCCCAGCLARVNDPASAISANLPSSSLGSYVLFDEKWGADDLGTGAVVEWAFTVGLFPGGDVQNVSTGSTLYRAVRDAFDRWEELIDIDFVERAAGTNPSQVGISIYLEDLEPDTAEPGGTLAVAYPAGDEEFVYAGVTASVERDDLNLIVKRDLSFDITDFADSASNYTDARATALHEIGHAIGLAHVDDRSQLMYAFALDGVDDLGIGDIVGAQLLYGAADGAHEYVSTGSDGGDFLNRSSTTESVVLLGRGGADRLFGGTRDDLLVGGAGNDDSRGGNGSDVLIDTFGNNNLDGQGGADSLGVAQGRNTLEGGGRGDTLLGGFGSDTLEGESGDDLLSGDGLGGFLGSADRLIGGAGDDTLMGGPGADIFVFAPGSGDDVIGALVLQDIFSSPGTTNGPDFTPGVDRLDISAFNATSVTSLLSNAAEAGGDTVLSFGGASLRLIGIAPGDLSASDFIL